MSTSAFNRSVLRKDDVVFTGDTPAALAANNSDQPKVKLHREGTSVQKIEITCKCGCHIILDCKYD